MWYNEYIMVRYNVFYNIFDQLSRIGDDHAVYYGGSLEEVNGERRQNDGVIFVKKHGKNTRTKTGEKPLFANRAIGGVGNGKM